MNAEGAYSTRGLVDLHLVLCSDTHGCLSSLKASHSRGESSVLHLGDFSDFGKLADRFFESWKPAGIPLYFVSGNHETLELCREIEDEHGAVCLDYAWRMVGDVLLVGLAGYDIFGAARKQNILRFGRKLRESGVADGSRFTILMTHEPPWPWEYEGKVRGDMNITEFVREFCFDLVLTGHWHEKKPRVEQDDMAAPTLNPGMQGCIIDLDPAGRKWSIDQR